MKNILPIILVTLGFIACHKHDYKIESEKVRTKIDEFFKSSICETGASVKEYSFNDELVYVFDPGNCGADFSLEVINESAETLGHLGGITGNQEISGVNFYEHANYKRTIRSN